MKLAVLASHGGTNLQAILDGSETGAIESTVKLVISNNRNAPALERAKRKGIYSTVINGITNPLDEDRDRAILKELRDHDIEYVVLAGYMKLLGQATLKEYKGKIINIHPALLPKYGGKGMYGIHVHKAVIENSEERTGITVHLVDETYDTGRILHQVEMDVLRSDTPETLQKRVLEREHKVLLEAIRLLEQ